MLRRQFSQGLLAGAVGAVGLQSLAIAQANEELVLEEGKNFWVVKPRLPNDAPAGKIRVTEFFAYSCNHCYAFAPEFKRWAQEAPKDLVEINQVPVSFRPLVEPHAQLFYTLEALNRLDDLNEAAFDSVQNKKQFLLKPEDIQAFFAQHQVDVEEGMKIYNSFGIQAKVKRANQLVEAYGIEGTPSVGVAGMFFATGASKQTLKIVDELIARAKTELSI